MKSQIDSVLPYLPACLITILTIRSVVLGSNIGDAIAILALTGLYGYKAYLDTQVKLNPTEDLIKEVEKLKGEISTVAVAVSQRPQKAPAQWKF